MKTMIPPQVGMRLRTLQKEKKEKKEKGQRKKEGQRKKRERKEKNKMREKERRDNATIPFSTLVLQSSTMFFIQRVSYIVTFIYWWEFFIIELGLYIPMMGFLKVP